MTLAVTVAASPASGRVGAAPAGLNPAQLAAFERLQAARAARTTQPLDLDYLADEAAWERNRRWSGEDV